MLKTYNVQPNAAQKETMKRAFHATVYAALLEEKEVEVVVNHFQDQNIEVGIFISGALEVSRVIGPRGGIK